MTIPKLIFLNWASTSIIQGRNLHARRPAPVELAVIAIMTVDDVGGRHLAGSDDWPLQDLHGSFDVRSQAGSVKRRHVDGGNFTARPSRKRRFASLDGVAPRGVRDGREVGARCQ